MLCGLTASTSTSLLCATRTFDSTTETPVSAASAARAVSSGSLARTASARAVPARIIPRISAVAILPAPMNPQRNVESAACDINAPPSGSLRSTDSLAFTAPDARRPRVDRPRDPISRSSYPKMPLKNRAGFG
jgi:hypothetical protein